MSDTSNSCATDGKCHNSQRNWYGQECGKPAVWIGTKASGWQSGFCEACYRHGDERHEFKTWRRIAEAA